MAAGSEILAWKKAIEAQPLEEATSCPNCEGQLRKSKRGKHCPFCGWTEFFTSAVVEGG